MYQDGGGAKNSQIGVIFEHDPGPHAFPSGLYDRPSFRAPREVLRGHHDVEPAARIEQRMATLLASGRFEKPVRGNAKSRDRLIARKNDLPCPARSYDQNIPCVIPGAEREGHPPPRSGGGGSRSEPEGV